MSECHRGAGAHHWTQMTWNSVAKDAWVTDSAVASSAAPFSEAPAHLLFKESGDQGRHWKLLEPWRAGRATQMVVECLRS